RCAQRLWRHGRIPLPRAGDRGVGARRGRRWLGRRRRRRRWRLSQRERAPTLARRPQTIRATMGTNMKTILPLQLLVGPAKNDPRPLILYHGRRCPDGYGAALAAWLFYEGEAEFRGLDHGEINSADDLG